MSSLKFRRRADARPAELLDAALRRFLEVGFGAARVEEIAALAGVTVGTVYRYFPSKEALVQALVERHVDAAWSRGREITEAYGTRTAREVVVLLLQRFGAALREPGPRGTALLVTREAPLFPSAITTYVEQLLAPGTIAVERALRHGIERGEFPLLPVELTARAMVSTVLQTVIWEETFATRLPAPRYDADPLDVTVTLLVRGLPRGNEEDAGAVDPVPRHDPVAPAGDQRAEEGNGGRLRITTLRPPGRG